MLISFYLSKCMYASVVLRHEANGPISSSVQEWRPIPMQPATQHGPPQLHSSRARADIDLVPAADAISNQRRVPRAVLRQYIRTELMQSSCLMPSCGAATRERICEQTEPLESWHCHCEFVAVRRTPHARPAAATGGQQASAPRVRVPVLEAGEGACACSSSTTICFSSSFPTVYGRHVTSVT